jgi:trigger factor
MAKSTTDESQTTEEKKKVAVKKATTTKKAPAKATAKKAPVKKAAAAKTPKTPAKEAAPAKTPAKEVAKAEAPVKGIIETFKTESISFEKETLPNCRIKYTAVPAQPLWDKARKQAIKNIAKEVSIPGFRKGKAPESIILKKHGAQVIQSTETALADICFAECQKEAKMPILHGNNNVSFHVEGEGTEKKLYFAFEAEPTLPALDFGAFSLAKTETEEVDEKRVEEEIDQVRSFYANWEQIEDRAVEEGDFVLLDIDDLDQDPPARVFNAARFEVTEKKMVSWMRDLVIGLKKDVTIEGISKADDDASDEDKESFKEKKVSITVTSIEKSTLPAIDDELAKKVGTQDVAEMKEKLKALIASKAARKNTETLRESIEKQLIEKVIFDVPASLLEKEANHRVSQLFNNPEFKKQWEEELSEEQKEVRKAEIKDKATQAIRLFYLCRDIVNTNKISVGDSDLKSDYDSVLDMMYADQTKLQYPSMNEEQKQMALTQVMMHKAEDYIVEQVKKA